MRALMKLSAAAIPVAALGLVVVSSALADPRISATATANPDRSISVNWNIPASTYGGAFIVNTTSTTDFTGELPFDYVGDPTIDFDLIQSGWTTYKTLPLNMTITQPTTVYAQVQLIDPFNDGSCTQGDFGADCDSQVIPLTIQPICSQTVVTPGHYTKKLLKRAHWLRRHGKRVKWSKRYHRPQYAKRHGYVWVKATYKQVWVTPVYETQCH
jgi:hypothetical protein